MLERSESCWCYCYHYLFFPMLLRLCDFRTPPHLNPPNPTRTHAHVHTEHALLACTDIVWPTVYKCNRYSRQMFACTWKVHWLLTVPGPKGTVLCVQTVHVNMRTAHLWCFCSREALPSAPGSSGWEHTLAWTEASSWAFGKSKAKEKHLYRPLQHQTIRNKNLCKGHSVLVDK